MFISQTGQALAGTKQVEMEASISAVEAGKVYIT